MIKEFFLKKVLDYKLKNVPEEQKKFIMTIMEKNPELFQKISKEIEHKTKQGEGQMKASIDVMKKYQSQLRDVLAGTDIKI